MNWNFNIEEAPKSYVEEYQTTDKDGKVINKTRFVPVKIIAASECGIVTVSYWIPNDERWNMFTDYEAPIAWMPWPEHPNKEKQR